MKHGIERRKARKAGLQAETASGGLTRWTGWADGVALYYRGAPHRRYGA